jgi:hypothetical protein
MKKEDEDFVMAATLNGEKPVIIRKPIPIEDLVKSKDRASIFIAKIIKKDNR